MALSPGDKLGPYELGSPIGEGGMGEVWKARDTRLDRVVAIKVSKQEFTERFEREARVIAALNHPNICQLYDVGPNYLVMEFIEGTQLKGSLPVEKAVEYAGQILDALDAAHKKGITHRDLKPANILITKQGIKLLDFGLAKQTAFLKQTDATLTKALTAEGQIAGTLQYMSPEQLQAKDADAGSDIFAFGCVLYEMISGKKAFDGASAAIVIGAILHSEPAALAVSEPLNRVIRTSLAKDPDHRFQSALDLKRSLRWAQETPPAPAAGAVKSWRVAAMAATAVAIVLGVFALRGDKPPKSKPVTFQVLPPAGRQLLPGTVRVSPNGEHVALIAGDGQSDRAVWVRTLASLDAIRLPGPDGAELAFWSPDNESVGFAAGGKLWRVATAGRAAETICAVEKLAGATWGSGGTILIGSVDGPIRQVPAAGGIPADLTKLDSTKGETGHSNPAFLPDGEHFIYRVFAKANDNKGVFLGSIRGGAARRLPISLIEASRATLSPPVVRYGGEHLLYSMGDRVVAHRFDTRSLQFLGEPFSISRSNRPSLTASVSENGTFVDVQEANATDSLLVEVDRRGGQLRSFGPQKGSYTHPELSPDGRTLAVDYLNIQTQKRDIWTIDIAANLASKLTSTGSAGIPVWAPDGRSLYYKGEDAIYSLPVAGDRPPMKIADAGMHHSHVSPDGRFLVYPKSPFTLSAELWMLSLDGSGKQSPVSPSRLVVSDPQFSPDGRWLAYHSLETGEPEVYIQSFPLGKGKWRVSREGGATPRWRRDGRELYFLAPGAKMMAVAISTADKGGLQVGMPMPLFGLVNFGRTESGRYAVAGDGQSFFYSTAANAQSSANAIPFNVTLHWSGSPKP